MAPVGSPVALSATDWVCPPVVAVVMVLVVRRTGVHRARAGRGRDGEVTRRGGVPALNRAMPAAQYMAVAKDPAKLCGPGAAEVLVAAPNGDRAGAGGGLLRLGCVARRR